jgi:Putative Actinobacterial Holin-X, holin superfamily III
MEEDKSHFTDVAEKATEYMNTRLELGRMKAMEYGALAFAAVMSKFIVLLICFCCLIFASLALAIYISFVSANIWLGCLVVAALYFLLFLIVYFNRKRLLDSPLANGFIRHLNKPHDN